MNSLLDCCKKQNKKDALKILTKIVPELSINNIIRDSSSDKEASSYLKVIK